MSVTAAQLSKTGARGGDLDATIREQLRIIDDKLLHVDKTWGRNVMPYDLPVTFGFPGLNKKDAQRIIYSTILRSLHNRGFEIGLQMEADKTILYIAWMTDLDVEEVEAMNALIRSKRIPSEGVAAFLARGRAAAPRTATEVRAGRARPAPPMVVAATQVMKPRGGLESAGGRGGPVREVPAAPGRAERELLGGTQ